MNIALFGFYPYGNFGDDLMAVLLAEELRRHGANPLIYGLLPEIAEEFGFTRTDSIDDLLADTGLLVFGGGGAFLRSDAAEFHEEIEWACEICARRHVPIVMISVGGDGGPVEGIPEARLRILREARLVTLRNPEDAPLQAEMSGRSAFSPDIVWTAARRLGVAPAPSPEPVVAVDASLLERTSLRLFLRGLMLACRVFRRPFRFRFFSTTHAAIDPPSGRILSYRGVRSFTEFLSSCSLVITPRLHAGLVALSQGIPVMVPAPHGKASLLFRRHGLDRYVFRGKRRALALGLAILRSRDFEWCRPDFRAERFEESIRKAEEHFSRLLEEISRIRSEESSKETPD